MKPSETIKKIPKYSNFLSNFLYSNIFNKKNIFTKNTKFTQILILFSFNFSWVICKFIKMSIIVLLQIYHIEIKWKCKLYELFYFFELKTTWHTWIISTSIFFNTFWVFPIRRSFLWETFETYLHKYEFKWY